MALSEEEQRLLQQMEADLLAEDPKFAHTLRGTGARRLHRRRAALAGGGFLLGLTALVAGMELSPIVSVLGFVIMLASTVLALTSWQQVGDTDADQSAHDPSSPVGDAAFMDRLEERWRRRQDEGL